MKLVCGIIIGILLIEIIRTIIDIIMLNYDEDEKKRDYYGRLK